MAYTSSTTTIPENVGFQWNGHLNGMINVAEICLGTRALGPGLRSALWVQGCPFRCPGCVAPDWIPDRPVTAAWRAMEAGDQGGHR